MKDSFIIENPIDMAFQNMKYNMNTLAFINYLFPRVSDSHVRRQTKQIIKLFNTKFANENEFLKVKRFFEMVEKSKAIGSKEFLSVETAGEKVTSALHFMANMNNLAVHTPQFIREMSIVFLVTSFENFLAEILKVVLLDQPKSLIPSEKHLTEKHLTYSQILEQNNMDGLIRNMIDRELSDLFYKNIDEMNEYLKKKFKFLLSGQKEWHEFREVFYRRNLIVHNNGFPNDEYRKKTGHKDKERLTVDKEYLDRSLKVFYVFLVLITKKFYNKKFSEKRETKAIE